MPVTCGTISDGSGTLAAGAGADAEAVDTAGAAGADGTDGGNGGGGATVRVPLGCDSLAVLAGTADAAVAAAAADGLDVVVDAGRRSGSSSSSGTGTGSGSAAADSPFGSTALAVNAAVPSSAWPSPCIST